MVQCGVVLWLVKAVVTEPGIKLHLLRQVRLLTKLENVFKNCSEEGKDSKNSIDIIVIWS